MAICEICGRDPKAIDVDDATGARIGGHACHCVRVDGERIAVGICCGRELGEELLRAEDESPYLRKRRAE